MMHFDFDGGLANHRFATRLLASKRDGHEKPALPTRRQQGQQAKRSPCCPSSSLARCWRQGGAHPIEARSCDRSGSRPHTDDGPAHRPGALLAPGSRQEANRGPNGLQEPHEPIKRPWRADWRQGGRKLRILSANKS